MKTMRALLVVAAAVMLSAAAPAQALAQHVTGHVEAHPWGDGRSFDHGVRHERHDYWSHWGHPVYRHHYARSYAYFCPSAGAYYPYVTSCYDDWIVVPAW